MMRLILPLLIGASMLALPGRLLADINSEVKAVLGDKLLRRSTVGIEVVRLGKTADEASTIYKLESQVPLIPASNLKLLTTSAALDRLGPLFRFRTMFLRRGPDVAIIGDGDPSFGDVEFLRRAGWGTTTVFDNWAAALKKQNTLAVHDVLVDDGIFDGNFVQPHWPANQLDQRYAAEVAGLSLNANCVDFTITSGAAGSLVGYTMDPPTKYLSVRNTCVVGSKNAVILAHDLGSNQLVLKGQAPPRGPVLASITIQDPPLFAATVFSESLARAGISMTGAVRRQMLGAQRTDWAIIGIHETPLFTALARANKDSMNLYAESLCKRLGAYASHAPGSWTNGTAAVGEFLKRAGVPAEQFTLDDGSGLSKLNTISPHGICKVLAYDFASANHQIFFDSLSIAGVDGTLEERFRGSDLRRRVFGKSGFVEGVSSLSGYLKARDGEWYAFSILMNGIPHLSNSEVKGLQERIVKAIDASPANASAR